MRYTIKPAVYALSLCMVFLLFTACEKKESKPKRLSPMERLEQEYTLLHDDLKKIRKELSDQDIDLSTKNNQSKQDVQIKMRQYKFKKRRLISKANELKNSVLSERNDRDDVDEKFIERADILIEKIEDFIKSVNPRYKPKPY